MKRIFGSIKHFLKRYKIINIIYSSVRNPRRRKAIQNEGFTVIKMIDTIFSELKIKYFIDFGTLLGFIRENNFIAHDLDIDIGIPFISYSDKENIGKQMIRNGFSKVHEFEYNNTIVEQAYIINGVKVDLFYYEHDKTHSYCYSFFRVPEIKYSSLNLFSTFKSTYSKIEDTEYKIINGIKVSVPKNPEDVLVEKYGKNWKVSNKDWEYWQAPTISRLDDFGKMIKQND